jgi:hypothetical protein
MSRRAAAILLAVLVAAVAALLFVGRIDWSALRRRAPRRFLRVTPALAPPVTPAPGVTAPPPAETVRITLYFPDQNGMLLHPEERDIPKPAAAALFLRALFAELQKGPSRAGLIAVIPEKMQLRNAFLLREGEAVLDLAVDSGLTFGSDEELSIVAALVDTTLQNVAETSRVRILINGEPVETLGGHVDLTRPLLYIRGAIEPPGSESAEAPVTPGTTPSPPAASTPSPKP